MINVNGRTCKIETRVGNEAGDFKGRRDWNHLFVLGWIGASTTYDYEEREQHLSIFAKSSGRFATRFSRTEVTFQNSTKDLVVDRDVVRRSLFGWISRFFRSAAPVSLQVIFQLNERSLVEFWSVYRSVTADQLMYVKEDLILPQTNTFYDFIVTKARGKSGPLFSFDVRDDVRLVNDASVEKEETHAGKVVLRNWYKQFFVKFFRFFRFFRFFSIFFDFFFRFFDFPISPDYLQSFY